MNATSNCADCFPILFVKRTILLNLAFQKLQGAVYFLQVFFRLFHKTCPQKLLFFRAKE